ncbi:MAG: hypothetical protein ACAI18_13125 [Gemmatimonadales bacterium]
MRGKVYGTAIHRTLLFGGAVLGWSMASAAVPPAVEVAGRVTILDKDNRPADDVGQAVVWLDRSGGTSTSPVRVEIGTSEKQFSPHVVVIPVGSTVAFPNHDPFNHNVFSLSEENPFDLGLYSRGETREARFTRPGIVRVYCNVHAQMSAIVLVRDNPWFAQPSGDGAFALPSVPPGRYQLHAWHERAPELTREVEVPADGVAGLALELDARGYQFKPHLNKFGQPYPQQGRRY